MDNSRDTIGPGRVLVVEDDPNMAKLLKNLLQARFDTEVEFAEGYAEAMNRVSAEEFDLVTIDIILPDGNGLDLVGEIAQIEKAPAVVVVTGRGNEESAARAFRMGALGYVPKDRHIYEVLPEVVKDAFVKTSDERARSKELKDLIDLVAHQLRQLATLFKGYTYALSEYGPDLNEEEVLDALRSIDEGANQIVRTANRLMDTSMIERGKVKLSLKEMDPVKIMNRAVQELRFSGYRNPMNISPGADMSPILADSEKIKDVSSILIDNAINYSPQGAEIDIEVTQDGGETVFRVSDRGPGIPLEERDKIFSRFHRVSNILPNYTLGIGLGLFIAKTFVEAHGGWIEVDQREGGGSTFSFGVPNTGPQSDS